MKFIHDITYWTQNGFDIYGKPSWDGPNYIKGRWEQTTRLYTNALGQTVGAKSSVLLPLVLAEGDYIFFGTSEDLEPPEGSEEINTVRKVFNVSGKKVDIEVLT